MRHYYGFHQFGRGAQAFGCFEVFQSWSEDGEWYWWPAFPGCLADGDPSGPYSTAKEAYEAAQDF